MSKNKIFKYCWTDSKSDHVAGIVVAMDKKEAEKKVRVHYQKLTEGIECYINYVEEVKLTKDDIAEIFYG